MATSAVATWAVATSGAATWAVATWAVATSAAGTWAAGDLGRGDLGRGDLGGGDLFVGDPNTQEGELDFETAGDLARTPPNEFTACVIGVDCPGSGTPLHAVSLGWTAPNVGGVPQYVVYRVEGDDAPARQRHAMDERWDR